MFAYVGLPQNLKDLKDLEGSPFASRLPFRMFLLKNQGPHSGGEPQHHEALLGKPVSPPRIRSKKICMAQPLLTKTKVENGDVAKQE